ncbi:MAG: arginyltransferase [Candidatus Dactylopiibacterium carminicum]|nr:MAG: arginyltransferase [Candidatus Dactylopiibacterium carminicum]
MQDLPYSLLQFYTTAPYECSYLAQRLARSQVATPGHLVDALVYGELVRQGFRRSGIYTYRPWCDQCQACIPVRLPVADFTPNRSQRRTWQKHAGLRAEELPLRYREDHYELYRRYQLVRHNGGGMDQDSREQYGSFLLESQVDTRLIEFREAGVLRMVSIIDRLSDGLSSVYTFFDPEIEHASFGGYGVLWQIEACRQIGGDYVYLGYWIRDCGKMSYKRQYRPLEGLIGGSWRRLEEEDFLHLG